MKLKIFTTFCFCLAHLCSLVATPTSLFWTICTTDVQPQGTWHIGVDNYFSVGNRAANGSSFPPDIGLTAGAFSKYNFDSEVGIDYLGGVEDPFLFNGKIGISEGKLFDKAPSFSVGIFNIGTSHERNQAVLDAVIGYTLPDTYGRVFAGLYHGRHSLGKIRSGWMAGYQKGFCDTKDSSGKEYVKWQLTTDYASGKNAIGGGGVGIAYFFTPAISMLTGPIWFKDTEANGRWKWSLQLDFDI